MSPSFAAARHGAVFSPSLLHSSGFRMLGAFVLINTVMFLALAILKLLPRVYVGDWISSPNRRAESRGIYPESPDAARAATAGLGMLIETVAPTTASRHRHRAATGPTVRLPRLRRSRPRHRR